MKKMINVTSHKLTGKQLDEIMKELNITIKIDMPEQLQQIWSNIPSTEISIYHILKPLLEWIDVNSRKNDYVLVQGDYGATYIVVNHCFKCEYRPCYVTTERKVIETPLEDGAVNINRTFKHTRIRKYENNAK